MDVEGFAQQDAADPPKDSRGPFSEGYGHNDDTSEEGHPACTMGREHYKVVRAAKVFCTTSTSLSPETAAYIHTM